MTQTADTGRAGLAARGGSTSIGAWRAPSARERWEIIGRTKTVAMVGASPNRSRPSYFVATYLLSSSCSFQDVWFVHPTADEILGRPVYKSLADLPAVPDLVEVFRKPSELPEVAEEAIAVGAKTLWFQLGLWDEAVAHRAHAAGLEVVMNRCPKIEYGRLSGEIGWAGVNAGAISSKRPLLSGRGVQSHVIAGKR